MQQFWLLQRCGRADIVIPYFNDLQVYIDPSLHPPRCLNLWKCNQRLLPPYTMISSSTSLPYALVNNIIHHNRLGIFDMYRKIITGIRQL